MAKNFLDKTGLAYAFTKIKAFVDSAVETAVSTKAPLHAVAEGITTAGDGAAYTATVEGITALTAGATFMMIPHTVSTSKTATLNVNGLGAKTLRRRLSNSTVSTTAPSSENWLGANKPVRVIYDGTYWIADFTRPNAADIYGTLPIANGGTGATTAAAALANIVTDGSIARANLANDALYSPIIKPTTATYDIQTSDIGKTIIDRYTLRNSAITWSLSKAVADAIPSGTEIAFLRSYNTVGITLNFTGLRIINSESGPVGSATKTVSFSLPERGSMCAIKKLENDSTYGSFWILTGNVEVVS